MIFFLLKIRFHPFGNFHHVHFGTAHNVHQNRAFAIHGGQHIHFGKAVLDVGNIAHTNGGPVRGLANNDLIKVFAVIGTLAGTQLHIAQLGADIARRNIDRCAPDGPGDVCKAQPITAQGFFGNLNGDFFIAGAKQIDLRHAGNERDFTAADNQNRGKALSLYMIVQMVGVVSAQALLLVGDPSGYETFVIASVIISISFAPILLSITPTPAFETAKPMSLRQLYNISPLGCVGMFLLGGVFSSQFGMTAVYGVQVGLSLPQISAFVAMFYLGAMLMQYPLGWLSDRMDRRLLILAVALGGGAGSLIGMTLGGDYRVLLFAAFLVGGLSNPLYSLLIAHTNDYLEHDDMAAASGGLVFINGLGAIAGPLITGWLMGTDFIGPSGLFMFMGTLLFALAAYAAYRATQRPAIPVEETGSYAPMYPSATPVAVEFAQEIAIEAALEEQENEISENSESI